jgi:hypothetical protein
LWAFLMSILWIYIFAHELISFLTVWNPSPQIFVFSLVDFF